MPPEMMTEAMSRTKVRLLRAGSGSKVLFLHGAGGFPGWLPIFEQLSARQEVIVPEHPNFGGSEEAPELRNVGDYAYYYLDVLDKLDLSQLHVVGHSLGGWIAAELAVRNCARLASLTLLAPAGVRIKGVPMGDNFIWSPVEAVRNLFHNQDLAEQILSVELNEEQQVQLIRTKLIAARLGWQPRWFNPDLKKWLHRITVPTQLVWGEEDKLLPAAYSRVWKERVPNMRCSIIPECGHSPHVEQTGKVLEILASFLQEQKA